MKNEMTINEIIATLGGLRYLSMSAAKDMGHDPEATNKEVAACETAIAILAALTNEGCADFNEALDILQDYKSLSKQYKAMHQKYEVPEKMDYRDGMWHCPSCGQRTNPRNRYCSYCGKRIGWP